MKTVLNFGLALVVVALLSGCEWDSSGDEGSWNDSYSWINFSGLYRGLDGMLVREFEASESATSTTTTTISTTTTTDDGTTITTTVVNGESAGTAPSFQTSLNGGLNFRPGIVPGSVTFVLNATVANGSSGSVTDDGSGGLSGSVNLVGPDSSTAQPVTGTINYDTGVWTMDLTSPGLVSSADVFVSYSYNTEVATDGGGSGGDSGTDTDTDTGDSGLGIAGGDVFSIMVEQTGNKLRFVDSNGNSYEGFLSVVSLAGGDSTGQSSGAVSATYEVKGVAGGQTVKISGSFSGAYLSPSEASSGDDDTPRIYGKLTDRIMEGIWMQPDGTADVYGIAPQVSVEVQTTTTTE